MALLVTISISSHYPVLNFYQFTRIGSAGAPQENYLRTSQIDSDHPSGSFLTNRSIPITVSSWSNPIPLLQPFLSKHTIWTIWHHFTCRQFSRIRHEGTWNSWYQNTTRRCGQLLQILQALVILSTKVQFSHNAKESIEFQTERRLSKTFVCNCSVAFLSNLSA